MCQKHPCFCIAHKTWSRRFNMCIVIPTKVGIHIASLDSRFHGNGIPYKSRDAIYGVSTNQIPSPQALTPLNPRLKSWVQIKSKDGYATKVETPYMASLQPQFKIQNLFHYIYHPIYISCIPKHLHIICPAWQLRYVDLLAVCPF